MKREELLKMLENHKGKDMLIEVKDQIIQKVTMQKYIYQIIGDRIYIRNSSNLHFAVINLNTVRSIEQDMQNITIYIDDKNETKIKISVI